ncbi:MAG: DUF502 domain-containing protein [Myxococcota bacterium]|nr:DUF502 domain-containing protein [Myxococcota bacterium]
MKKNTKRTFITGLVIILPIVITLWVVKFIVIQTTSVLTPAIHNLIASFGLGTLIDTASIKYLIMFLSLVLTLLVIYFVGLIGGTVIGKQLLVWFERLLMQVPVVRSVYSAVRQFLDTFSRSDGSAFRKVVMVEYPRKGLWTLALLTADTKGEIQSKLPQEMLSVFVPTTPNPTSGWLLLVPKDDVIELEMSVDEAFKLIISGGVLTPEYKA